MDEIYFSFSLLTILFIVFLYIYFRITVFDILSNKIAVIILL